MTNQIRVTAVPVFLPEQSMPEEDHFVWAYTILIENTGNTSVQLINRYWHITDANGNIQDVRGPGVVGEQPTLAPGEVYRYTSGTSLHTSSGMMVGQYEMLDHEGKIFTIDIPAFSLDSPDQVARPN